MNYQWQLPARWEDFEDLCYRLVLAEGTIASASKYGRRGQRQFGLDIAGMRKQSRSEWDGFQCKLKTEHLGGKLGEDEIVAEVEKEKSFRPALKGLTFLTTGPSDNRARDVVNAMNASASKPFDTDIWFWEDIVARLENNAPITQRFYPQLFPTKHITMLPWGAIESHFFSGQEDCGKRLHDFFSHDLCRRLGVMGDYIATAVSEHVQNCLSTAKGKATRMALEFDGFEVRISDNGISFDPFDTSFQPAAGQLGLNEIRRLRTYDSIDTFYIPKDVDFGNPTNSLVIGINLTLQVMAAHSCIAYADSEVFYDRAEATKLADQAGHSLALRSVCAAHRERPSTVGFIQ